MSYESEFMPTNFATEPAPEQIIWLMGFADRLNDYACKPNGQSGHYYNEEGRRGFYICYKYFGPHSDMYLMISRSRTDYMPTKEKIVTELISKEIEVRPEWYGKYHAHLATPGTYATVQYGSLWYMLSESGIPEPFHKTFQGPPGRYLRFYASAGQF